MLLSPAYFDTQLIKGEILQYCKGLIDSIKNNHILVEQYFHSGLSGDKDFKHHKLQRVRGPLLLTNPVPSNIKEETLTFM